MDVGEPAGKVVRQHGIRGTTIVHFADSTKGVIDVDRVHRIESGGILDVGDLAGVVVGVRDGAGERGTCGWKIESLRFHPMQAVVGVGDLGRSIVDRKQVVMNWVIDIRDDTRIRGSGA